MTWLAVVIGGAVGAAGRYLVTRWLGVRRGVPWGTLAVNGVGSFLLGCVLGAGLPPWWVALLGSGFCGALTTFSSYATEVVDLVQYRAWLLSGSYAVGSIAVGLLACWAGWALVR